MPDLYIGTCWNTDMPTRGRDIRKCPHCNFEGEVDVMAYSDAEYWTCPRCKSKITGEPERGKFGRKVEVVKVEEDDRTKVASDFKRNVPEEGKRRKNLTFKTKVELGLESEEV